MSDKEIYKKTLIFSLYRVLWDIGSFIVISILGVLGFFISVAAFKSGLPGLIIGVIIGIIIVAIASHFISYVFKAGQIAMMTKGVTEGKLPDNVFAEGKKVVQERFVTVALYYAATNAIKGIFNQLGRAITKIGESVGGKNGGTIGSIISTIIQVIVDYLCDCCLGWVFYMKDENAFKATLQGAVLFFKKGKTFLKNMGRVFGIGIATLVIIGGVFFGIGYGLCQPFPDFFQDVANEFAEDDDPETAFLADPNNVKLVASGIFGVMMWAIIHSTFIRPYVLIGVLRNFIESGKNEQLTDDDYAEVAKKSKKFQKVQEKADA